MHNEHRRACTGQGCSVCRHLARQKAAHARKLAARAERAVPARRAGGPRPDRSG
jgi:sRNA-binding protein